MLTARLKHWIVFIVVHKRDEGIAEFLKVDNVLGGFVATQWVTTRVPLRMTYMGMPETMSFGEVDFRSAI
jgi:hypothetical protein